MPLKFCVKFLITVLVSAKRIPPNMRIASNEPEEEPILPTINTNPNQVIRSHFSTFSAQYNKNYATVAEYNTRLNLWIETDQYIQNLDLRNTTLRLKHNMFSDLTAEER